MPELPVRKPWIGDRWEQDRLMVVGESHYSDEDPEDPEMTRKVVSAVVKGQRRLRFFTAIERVVSGCAPGKTTPADFWATVSFANFCPAAVPDRSVKATPQMIERGLAAFPAVLADLRPRRILFATKRCWDATERLEGVGWIPAETFEHDEHRQETGFFTTDDGRPGAYAMNIQHPAAYGWSASWWHLFVRDFLKRPLDNPK